VVVKGIKRQTMLHGIGSDPNVVCGNGPTFGLESFDNQSIVIGRFEIMQEYFNPGRVEKRF
jgi:hypothetical protein